MSPAATHFQKKNRAKNLHLAASFFRPYVHPLWSGCPKCVSTRWMCWLENGRRTGSKMCITHFAPKFHRTIFFPVWMILEQNLKFWHVREIFRSPHTHRKRPAPTVLSIMVARGGELSTLSNYARTVSASCKIFYVKDTQAHSTCFLYCFHSSNNSDFF